MNHVWLFQPTTCNAEMETHLDELVMRVPTCELAQPYKILTFQHTRFIR